MKKFLILMLLFSCNYFTYSYMDVADFNLKSTKDRNGKEVQLLYTSSYPSDFDERKAYIHFVAFIRETNDTFNILSPMAQSMAGDELDTKFTLYTEKDVIYQGMIAVANSKNVESGENQITNERFTKVLRDSKFDDVAKNNYETEFGVVLRPGSITDENPFE